jgi:ATP-binding cassette subfamily C protein CydCD
MSRPVDPRLLRRVPACRRLLVVLTGLQGLAAVLVVAQATVLANAIVTIFSGRAGVGAIVDSVVLLAAIGAARAGLAGAQEWLTARASIAVRAQLRRTTLDAIVRLGPMWARRQPPGRLVNATGPGLDALDGYVTRALPTLVAASVVPAVVLARITWADWQSGLILIVLLPLVPLFMALIGITTKRHVERQYAILARLAGQFLDLLRGLTTLRIYGQAEAQERTLRTATDTYRRHTLVTLRVAFLSGLGLDLLAALSVAVVAVDIGLRLDAGHVSFTTALVVLILAPELFAPLRAVGAQHHASEEGTTAAAAALDIVDEAPDATTAAAGTRGLSDGRVRLDGVTVTYPDRNVPALLDVTLAFEPRRVTALIGRSGAGKTTVLSTLLRYVEPEQGSVSVDAAAVELSAIDAAAWRESVAWVPQRPRPSQATVGDEVRLGQPDADDAAVADACRTCRTPAPATRLGEDGFAVSAGQRRRIALARAVLRARAVRAAGGVPLVLLDEPSEDLDRGTEAVVAAVIDDLRDWASVVVATHSAALIRLADRRITFGAGRVVEQVSQAARRPEPAHALAEQPVAVAPRSVPASPTPATDYRLRDLVHDAGATRRLVVAALLSVLAALSGLGLTASSMWLISRAAQHPNVQALAVAVVGVRTFAIGRALLRYAERLAAHDGALRMLSALRVRVFAALRPLPPAVLGQYGRGDLLRRFVGDVDGAQEGLVRALVPSAGALAGGLGAVVIATALAPLAGLYLAAGLLVAGVLVPALAYRGAGSGASPVRIAGDRDARSAAVLDALDELVAYGHTRTALDGVSAADARLARESRRAAVAAAVGTFGAGLAAALTMVAVVAAAASSVHGGRLPVVDVGVLVVCVLTGFESVAPLPSAFVAWARCRAGLLRVAEVTGRTVAFAEPAAPVRVPQDALGLRARGITLAPASDALPVLRDADLELETAQRIALVGPSGCGKSTVLSAVLRMLPVRKGSVALTTATSAADLRDMCAADVPPAIAGSLQGDHVFDATLRDNLRFVRPEASDDELDAVARRVGLLDDVRALPDGWSTSAGPDGAALSGGQRQRLLVARALLADPEILVLDEPTAHLDADTERVVLDDLLDATAGRTVLLTTHRRLDDGRADQILRMADGAFDSDPIVVPQPA